MHFEVLLIRLISASIHLAPEVPSISNLTLLYLGLKNIDVSGNPTDSTFKCQDAADPGNFMTAVMQELSLLPHTAWFNRQNE
jgi:hypothetical protein